jgi:hypothetical protein
MRFIDIVAPYNMRRGSGQIEQCQAHTSIQPHFFSFFLHEVHGVEFVLWVMFLLEGAEQEIGMYLDHKSNQRS